MAWVTIVYEREVLYKEVWAEPVTTVAKRYGVSDVAIRKTCAKLGVPLPPLGYWAKLKHGKTPPRPTLPRHGGPSRVVRRRRVDHPTDEPPPPPHPYVERQMAFEALPEHRIMVADTLRSAHPLVSLTRRAAVLPAGAFGYGASAAAPQLRIVASGPAERRALRIASALLKALETRRIAVRQGKDNENTPVIEIQGEQLSFRITERTRRIERELTLDERRRLAGDAHAYVSDRYRAEPTGELTLAIIDATGSSERRRFADGKQQRLEDRLNAVVVALVEIAVHMRLQHEEDARQEAHRRRLEAKRAKLLAVREHELKRLAETEKAVDAYHRATRLRAYAAALEGSTGRGAPDGPQMAELAWIRRAADWVDPLVAAPWPDVDRAEPFVSWGWCYADLETIDVPVTDTGDDAAPAG